MKSKAEIRHLRKLSLSIGDFIRYWGFRRIHGAIWTQLYLSKSPLSCKNLTERLTLSKALISPALLELCEYRLIEEVVSPNAKTKLYSAAENISDVIQEILRGREAKILKNITENFSTLASLDTKSQYMDSNKIDSLGKMILSGNAMLEFFLSQKDLLNTSLDQES